MNLLTFVPCQIKLYCVFCTVRNIHFYIMSSFSLFVYALKHPYQQRVCVCLLFAPKIIIITVTIVRAESP